MMVKTYPFSMLLGEILLIDDVEHLVVEVAPNQLRPVRLFTLSDGSKWTVSQLAEKLRSTETCARARLRASSDVERIFAPIRRIAGGKRHNVVSQKNLINPNKWYKDPLVKLMLKGGL